MVFIVNQFDHGDLQKKIKLLMHRAANEIVKSVQDDLAELDLNVKVEKSKSSFDDRLDNVEVKLSGFKVNYSEEQKEVVDTAIGKLLVSLEKRDGFTKR
jgi:hypothetical protein